MPKRNKGTPLSHALLQWERSLFRNFHALPNYTTVVKPGILQCYFCPKTPRILLIVLLKCWKQQCVLLFRISPIHRRFLMFLRPVYFRRRNVGNTNQCSLFVVFLMTFLQFPKYVW